MPITLDRDEARARLVSHLALERTAGNGAAGTRALLKRLRAIQLDPLDVIGTNADLVVMARVDDVRRGDVWRHLFPIHAFEHFAKERCILPADAFPWYRTQGHDAQTPWWRHHERQARVPERVIAQLLEEIRARGPLTARELTDHGTVQPIDWSGWKGTTKATTMALELLWTSCEIVVAGRTESGSKLYDVPERALPKHATSRVDPAEFPRWALRERAEAAGLLTRAGGSMWSMLSSVRTSPIVQQMTEAGELVDVAIDGSTRRYLAPASFLRRRAFQYDDRVRILGPLDPLLWDRDLVRTIFGFDYVWEVYKPAHQRKWGWYVCPLLHRGHFIGRIDARVDGATLVVSKLWLESANAELEPIQEALQRHASLCGASKVKIPRRVSRSPR